MWSFDFFCSFLHFQQKGEEGRAYAYEVWTKNGQILCNSRRQRKIFVSVSHEERNSPRISVDTVIISTACAKACCVFMSFRAKAKEYHRVCHTLWYLFSCWTEKRGKAFSFSNKITTLCWLFHCIQCHTLLFFSTVLNFCLLADTLYYGRKRGNENGFSVSVCLCDDTSLSTYKRIRVWINGSGYSYVRWTYVDMRTRQNIETKNSFCSKPQVRRRGECNVCVFLTLYLLVSMCLTACCASQTRKTIRAFEWDAACIWKCISWIHCLGMTQSVSNSYARLTYFNLRICNTGTSRSQVQFPNSSSRHKSR